MCALIETWELKNLPFFQGCVNKKCKSQWQISVRSLSEKLLAFFLNSTKFTLLFLWIIHREKPWENFAKKNIFFQKFAIFFSKWANNVGKNTNFPRNFLAIFPSVGLSVISVDLNAGQSCKIVT